MRTAKRPPVEHLPPLLLTREEVQYFLRYGESLVDQLITTGQVEVVGEGRNLRIVYDSVVTWVKQNKRAVL